MESTSSGESTGAGPAGPGASIQTFLVADVRGYTRFTVERGDEAGALLAARFADLTEEVIGPYRGRLVELRGDEALIVFASARDALRAAVTLQDRFAQAMAEDSTLPLQVGMGVDAGEAIPVRDGFRGGALNLAARLCSLAGPGEVFASTGVVHLARRVEGLVFVDRQTVSLKGMDEPVRVIQVARQGRVPAELPPLVPQLSHPLTNLPDAPTPFIGREEEIEAVTDLLVRERMRLVTLTGPGGTGKTRLAIEVAGRVLPDFEDGVFLAAFASVLRPELVPAAIATALGVNQSSAISLIEELHAYLRNRRLLLVLDNFEHLLDARTLVADLLDGCRHLTILIASRSVLRLSREQEYPVLPLPVPDLGALPPLVELKSFDALRLFVDRARALNPRFQLTEGNAAAIAGICARLDGLPLAIELAASRTRLFPPEALLVRLSNSLKLLTGGARDAPARQQTLRGAIDWSHDLLDREEQVLFARLAVFVRGFTVDAVEDVCGSAGDLGVDVLDGIESLAEKSLLQPMISSPASAAIGMRFGMLETVREYARERLEGSGELETLEGAHGAFFLSLAEAGEIGLKGAEQGDWLHRLEADHDNLRAALFHAIDERDASGALRLSAALWYFWWTRGYLSEGRRWLAAALALPGGDGAERARALNGAANLAWSQGELDHARGLHEQTLRLRPRTRGSSRRRDFAQ